MGTCGLAAGAGETYQAVQGELQETQFGSCHPVGWVYWDLCSGAAGRYPDGLVSRVSLTPM